MIKMNTVELEGWASGPQEDGTIKRTRGAVSCTKARLENRPNGTPGGRYQGTVDNSSPSRSLNHNWVHVFVRTRVSVGEVIVLLCCCFLEDVLQINPVFCFPRRALAKLFIHPMSTF